MARRDPLERYREKRDFSRTREPRGGTRRKASKEPLFVVQLHDARRRHYDFRLEAAGVLKSWAVPRGPSPDPREKRLAVPTEDHPLDYFDFEGVIPKGEYGGGPVAVWDYGTYRNLTSRKGKDIPVEEAVDKGHVAVWLEGHKLKGGYALTRIREGEPWIMVKMRDEAADPATDPVRDQPFSVLTGRTIDEIAREESDMAGTTETREIEVDGQTIPLSKPDKVLIPAGEAGRGAVSKADLVAYYQRIADVMVPHLRDRPLMMARYPDGVEAGGFYQKDAPDYFPDWIRRVEVPKEGGTVTHVVCDDTATLVYLAAQASITPHIWLSRADDLDHPDRVIFDLDPSEVDLAVLRSAARALCQLLEDLRLVPFVQLTGSRGLHVVVPLDRSADFDEVRDFARAVAELLVKQDPDHLTTEHRKANRGGRLFLDTLRNAYAQTAVAPYAVRTLAGAPLATPIAWRELSDRGFDPQRYRIDNIFRRLARRDDPWADIDRHARPLPHH